MASYVLQLCAEPVSKPILNQRTRCCVVPCVNDSGEA